MRSSKRFKTTQTKHFPAIGNGAEYMKKAHRRKQQKSILIFAIIL
jgi:hypothetical protein